MMTTSTQLVGALIVAVAVMALVGVIVLAVRMKGREKKIAELRIDRRKLETELERETRFLSILSHEIRNPLNAIVGYSTLLKEIGSDQSPEQRDQMIDRILHNSHLLAGMLNNVLDLSRIDMGRLQVVKKEVLLQEILEEVLREIDPAAREKGLEVVLTGRESVPPIVTDPEKARRILMILLQNAVRFTESGSIRIRFYPKPDDEKICVEIRDTGAGIPEKDLPHIFEPFYHVDSGGAFPEGTRLSLAIAQRLAEALEGTLQAASPPRSGAAFTLCLPGAPVGREEVRIS
jgi:signal transduction histidine kinase